MIRQRRQQIQRQRLSPKLRMLLFSSGVFMAGAVALIIYANTGLQLNAVAGPGMLGEQSFNQGTVTVNEFTMITADVKAGSTQINVASNTINQHQRFSSDLQAGELVMIVQMQHGPKPYLNLDSNTVSQDETGKYEFAEVAGVEEGPRINFKAPLKNSYAISGKSQVVRVPRYQSLRIEKGSTMTTDVWDGNTGGIVAIEVKGPATIHGTIDATGKGFNGKAFQKLLKRGADLRKGAIASDTTGKRIFFGAAAVNKTTNQSSNGGGIVYLISSDNIKGSGRIHADGSSIDNASAHTANAGHGGSVFICTPNPVSGIAVTANGGNALQHTDTSAVVEMRGMGGEGGLVRMSTGPLMSTSAAGGMHCTSYSLVHGFAIMDSARASAGLVTVSALSPYSKNHAAGIKLEYFAATSLEGRVTVSWATSSEEHTDYFTVEKSTGGQPFVVVHKTNGKGNAGIKSSYEFEDEGQPAASCTYRLSRTDMEGQTETYPPVMLKQVMRTTDTRLISVKPNPFSDQFTVNCTAAEPGLIEFTLTDISGNIIRRETAVTGEGINNIPVGNLAAIPKGTYFLTMGTAADKLATIKVMK